MAISADEFARSAESAGSAGAYRWGAPVDDPIVASPKWWRTNTFGSLASINRDLFFRLARWLLSVIAT